MAARALQTSKELLARLPSWRLLFQGRCLVVTNTVGGGLLMAVGDSLQQTREMRSEAGRVRDWRRTGEQRPKSGTSTGPSFPECPCLFDSLGGGGETMRWVRCVPPRRRFHVRCGLLHGSDRALLVLLAGQAVRGEDHDHGAEEGGGGPVDLRSGYRAVVFHR